MTRAKRIVGIEKEVIEAHRQSIAPKGLAFALGQGRQIQGFIPQTSDDGLMPRLVFRERVARILRRKTLDRVPKNIDPIAGREIEFQRVGLLEKIDGNLQNVRFGKRQMVLQNSQLVFSVRESYLKGRLESAQDVVGDLIGRVVLVHRHGGSKVLMGRNGDPRDDRFDIPTLVEQRG